MGRALSIFPRAAVVLATLAAGLVLAGAAPAQAQSSSCEQGGKLLTERKNIIQQINKLGKKLDASSACAAFGKLVNNGSAAVKWIEANKDWCSIPDTFLQGMKSDHEKATSLRTKACHAAAQQAAMQKKARQAQQGAGGGLLGGPGLTGEYKIPQGAL